MVAGKMNVKEKIKDIHLCRTVSDISRLIVDSAHTISRIGFYIVELMTTEGVRDQGYVPSFHYSLGAMEGVLRDVYSFISAGEYAVYNMVLARADWDREAKYFGNMGINNCVIAAVSLVMQDAQGHTHRQPVWKMLGASRKRIPVYGSGGWISYTDQEPLEEVLDYKRRGFGAIKIKAGPGSIERNVERLAKYREALGDSVKIMTDANQGFSVLGALELAHRASSMGIQRFEESVVHMDHAGYQLLRNQRGTALAMGEWEYDSGALKQPSVRNTLDLWQPDIVWLGGVEAQRESAALAEVFGPPVLPHYYKGYDIPPLCTAGSPYGAESFDWTDGIIDNAMEIENRFASPREGDGWGFRFRKECMTEAQELSWGLPPDRNWYHTGFPCTAFFSFTGPLK